MGHDLPSRHLIPMYRFHVPREFILPWKTLGAGGDGTLEGTCMCFNVLAIK
jgi:hypothetical protein